MKKTAILFAAGLCALCASAKGEITTLPAGGETVLYERSSKSYYIFEGGPMADYDSGNVGRITYYDNGDVYMTEPFNSIETKTYLKGRKEGDKLIFDLTDQPIFTLRDEGLSLQLWAKRVVYKPEFKNMKPSEDQNLVFYIREDGTIEMEGDQESLSSVVMLGMCDQFNMWRFYGEQLLKFVPITDGREVAKVPETAKVETWTLTSEETQYQVKVATEGDKIWISGIYDKVPESTICGTIGDDMVTFDGDAQYIGMGWNHWLYALPTQRVEYYDPTFETWLTNTEWLLNCTFDYDAEAKILKCRNDIMFNAGKEALAEVYTLHNPLITGPGVEYPYNKPAAPKIGSFAPTQYWPEENLTYGRIVFLLDRVDEDNAPLNEKNLFYQIFFNNETEPHVFKASDYSGLSKDTTDFPYGFEDRNNFTTQAYQNSKYHYCYFWEKDVTRAGVRAVYYNNGTPLYSDIVWSSDNDDPIFPPTGIEGIESDDDAVSVEYFDLSGRKAGEGFKGFAIKVAKHADGSISTAKVSK